MGIQQALEWCYSGRVFGADEALAGGLVRSLHAPEDLSAVARDLAREIVDNASPVSVALTRHMMWRLASAEGPFDAHLIDSALSYARGKSDDAKEGVASFLERRPPDFPGKISTDMPAPFPWWDASDVTD